MTAYYILKEFRSHIIVGFLLYFFFTLSSHGLETVKKDMGVVIGTIILVLLVVEGVKILGEDNKLHDNGSWLRSVFESIS